MLAQPSKTASGNGVAASADAADARAVAAARAARVHRRRRRVGARSAVHHRVGSRARSWPNSLLVLDAKTLTTIRNARGEQPPAASTGRAQRRARLDGRHRSQPPDRDRTDLASRRAQRRGRHRAGCRRNRVRLRLGRQLRQRLAHARRACGIAGRDARPQRPAVGDRRRRRLRLGDQQAKQKLLRIDPETNEVTNKLRLSEPAARSRRTRRARLPDDRPLDTVPAQVPADLPSRV